MIDIKLLREHPETVRENLKKRFNDVSLVDKALQADSEFRKLKQQVDDMRHHRNVVSEEINQLVKKGKTQQVQDKIQEAKAIPQQLSALEEEFKDKELALERAVSNLPNILAEDVPAGKDSSENVEIKKSGELPKFNFELKSHSEILESLHLADFDAGRNNAGEGFNYLKGEAALLDHALQRYGIDFLVKKGFSVIVPPMMLNSETLSGALNGLKDFEDVIYKIEKENLYVIGTAEHSLVSMYKNKTLSMTELPIKICALTPCFRKEIGAHGVDTKGLFRMHQFNKVEQVVFCHPEESPEMLEQMQKITEDFFKSLKIPYRVIEICSGDLGAKFVKQYDIEAWFPRQKKYAEVTSAGNCTDFQARALNIRYMDKDERKYVHILNNTMVATSRAMVAILENYQQKDGSIKVPLALQKYMPVKVIKKTNGTTP